MNSENKQNTMEPEGQTDDSIQQEAFDPTTFTIPDELNLEFKVTYDDVFKSLNHTDKVDGTAKRTRNTYLILGLMSIMEWAVFAYSQHGVSLVMALIFTALMLFVKKKALGVNHKVAKAFEEEEKQTLLLTNDKMEINGTVCGYQEEVKVYELDDAYTLCYQKNHVFVIPKNLLDERENCAFSRKMKAMLGDAYRG